MRGAPSIRRRRRRPDRQQKGPGLRRGLRVACRPIGAVGSAGNSGGVSPGRDNGRHRTMRHWITSFRLLSGHRGAAWARAQAARRARRARMCRRIETQHSCAARCQWHGAPGRKQYLPGLLIENGAHHRIIGSRTDPLAIPVSRLCNPTASCSVRLAMQSAANLGARTVS